MSDKQSVAEALHKYSTDRGRLLRARASGVSDVLIQAWEEQVKADAAEVDAAVDRRINRALRNVEIIG